MEKFFEILEKKLDTFNNNYTTENNVSFNELFSDTELKDEAMNFPIILELKKDFLKIVKKNELSEEYILKKDFLNLKEKYELKNTFYEFENLDEKIKRYKRNLEIESFEDFRRDTYANFFKIITKDIETYQKNNLKETQIKENLIDASNLFFQREFEIKFFHKESKNQNLPIDYYFKERDKEFNLTIEYGKIKEFNSINESYELNIITYVSDLSMKEINKIHEFLKNKSLVDIINIAPKIIKFESETSLLYSEIKKEIYSNWRKEIENKIIKENSNLELDCNNYKTSLYLDSYFEKYDLQLMSFEKKELENNYNKNHKINDLNKYLKELKNSNIIIVNDKDYF